MDKKALSERDICTKFITPAIAKGGWDVQVQVRENVHLTKCRVIVRGKLDRTRTRCGGRLSDPVVVAQIAQYEREAQAERERQYWEQNHAEEWQDEQALLAKYYYDLYASAFKDPKQGPDPKALTRLAPARPGSSGSGASALRMSPGTRQRSRPASLRRCGPSSLCPSRRSPDGVNCTPFGAIGAPDSSQSAHGS